ncbi:diguanylate cyclase [Glaciecola sp. XM2]|uniref:sensor domain-containing diguanylate cyclase n=1 Tax=Glaciecola sp. XM2 TaxID=1914931 RepID=UPI001BDDE7E4|nr:diguanylate cyclase [Glaciecola sp. XM2]MBT1449799.1 diguanylate cyclase [Glaciecola sp. XM2]
MQSGQLIPTDRRYWITAIISLFVICMLAFTVSLSTIAQKMSLPFSATYVTDSSETITGELPADITQQFPDAIWKPLINDNLGLSNDTHWIRVSLDSIKPGSQYLLEANYSLIDEIDVWVFNADVNGAIDISEPLATYSTGDMRSFDQRVIKHEQFLFPIAGDNEHMLIVLRVQSDGPIKLPIRVWQYADFISYNSAHQLFLGLFFGYMLAMALSNLFLFATTRNKIFAVYAGYVIGLALVIAALQGVGFRFFWPDSPWFQQKGLMLFACVTLALVIVFSIQVLDLKRNSPRAYLLLSIAKFIYVGVFALAFVLPYTPLLITVLIMMAITSPVILLASLYLAIQGNSIARYFSAAWLVVLFSGVVLTTENLGVYNLPLNANYLLMVGAIAETILLSLALAIRFSTQFEETERAKTLALENERQAMAAKDELLKVQEASQQDLEYRVEERTLELEIAMRELSEANQELERMSAIDPLTGLMNRRYFDKRLLAEARRSRREHRQLTLAMLDIDFFKKINDNYGHPAGDECLRVFSQLLQTHIKRPSDVICRYGGEEFVVILPATEIDGATVLMERVRDALEQTVVEFEGEKIKMTVSIGVTARVITSDDQKEGLLGFADQLLYKAKQNGRNRVIAETFDE